MGNIKSEVAIMAEHDDVSRCGICSEPFKDGEVAVQTVRWERALKSLAARATEFEPGLQADKFWAHPVCVFAIANEEEAAPSEKQKSK
jgi:hypothetical protein